MSKRRDVLLLIFIVCAPASELFAENGNLSAEKTVLCSVNKKMRIKFLKFYVKGACKCGITVLKYILRDCNNDMRRSERWPTVCRGIFVEYVRF